jgi:excisionase family DNA binding protein
MDVEGQPQTDIEVLGSRGASASESLTLSVPETARLLGISRALAYDLVRRGELPALRLGRRRLVPRAALADLMTGQSRPGTDS